MSKKNKPGSGIVYSTDPNFKVESEHFASESLSPSEQPLRIWLETKHRGGKAATIIKGYIIIQGDQRDKILGWLQKNGYSKSKKAGG
jgi:translation initiation factor 1